MDIGATNLRVALGDEEGRVLKRAVRRTPREGDELAVSREICRMVRELLTEAELSEVVGIGVGTIGPLDIRRGVIVNTPNLPFERIPVKEPLEEEFGLPVTVLNDCVAAVLGEWRFGLGRGLRNLVYITLSTGIGGGAVVDGHLLLGKDGNAHEIGHIVIDQEGRLVCGCGKRGHWEAYCSGSNIPNFVRLLLEEKSPGEVEGSLLLRMASSPSNITAKLLFDAAKRGDRLALEIVEEIGRLNAIGFANVINVYDPELITVGGSVALNNPELVLPPIRRYVGDYAINRVPRIELTPLGGDVVLLGALASVLHGLE